MFNAPLVQAERVLSEAKALGESVNAARSDINRLKAQIEGIRQKQAAADLTCSDGGGGGSRRRRGRCARRWRRASARTRRASPSSRR